MASNDDLFLAPLPHGGDDPPPPAPAPLPDDPPPPPRRRPRWLGPLALVAVVGALATIATVLGDGDPAASPEPTTTTTERPAGSRRSTTTTVAPDPVVLGPLLAEPTGTILVAVGERELVLVEVDTGVVRTVDLPGPSAHGAIAVGRSVVIQRTNGVVAVPIAVDAAPLTTGDPVRLTNDPGRAPLLSTGPSLVWLSTYSETGAELREVTLDGKATGRGAVLPPYASNVVAVDGGLVVPLLGTLTLYDPDTGESHDIGRGHALAGHGDTLARLVCEALVCQLHLTDLANDTDVVVDGPANTAFNPWGPAMFSPDGRWLTVVTGAADPETLAVVDVAAGRATVVESTSLVDPFSATFSADSRWLFSMGARGALRAHRLGTAETVTIEGVDLGSPTALVAVPDAG